MVYQNARGVDISIFELIWGGGPSKMLAKGGEPASFWGSNSLFSGQTVYEV